MTSHSEELAHTISTKRSQMGEHTPGPWAIGHRNGQACVRGPATECLATLPYAPCEGFGLTNVFEVVANADFIVRACNAHDDLLAALQMVVDTLDNEEMGEGTPAKAWVASWHTIHETARAAIAKAESLG